MALVSPVKLEASLVVLVGGGVNAQGAVGVTFGVVIFAEFILDKGLWIVLPGVCHHGGGVQANKGSVQYPQLIQLPYQVSHDLLQRPVAQFFQEPVIRPVGRQGFHDIKAAVMGDEPVVVQIVGQIGDL